MVYICTQVVLDAKGFGVGPPDCTIGFGESPDKGHWYHIGGGTCG